MSPQIHRSSVITNHYYHALPSLTKRDEASAFHCTGCKTPGYGLRYRCNSEGCNADLHSFCAHFSRKISFFMHPHELHFMAAPTLDWTVRCNVCTEPIVGCFYGCGCGKLDAHPVCAQLPESVVNDGVHPCHRLTYLFPRDQVPCGACGRPCDGWRYRCDQGCRGADFHLECLRGPANRGVGLGGKADVASGLNTSRSVNGTAGYCSPGRRKRDTIIALVTYFSFAKNIWEVLSWIFEMFG